MLFKRKRTSKFKKPRMEADFALQITSLADILIIVLIFLLKAFTNGVADTETLTVSNKIQLPHASSGGPAKDGLKVEIAKDKIDIDGRTVAGLAAFRFQSDDLNHDLGQTSSSKQLNAAFGVAKRQEVKTNKHTIWIVADHAAPYVTIQTVIASAALAGYQDFKLAVSRED